MLAMRRLRAAGATVVSAEMVAFEWLRGCEHPRFREVLRELTIRIVRILFPGVGLLVLSAWCLGILNTHRRFFLPYAAPTLWRRLVANGMREDFSWERQVLEYERLYEGKGQEEGTQPS